MAQLVINIPDNQVTRVVNNLCLYYGYDSSYHNANKVLFVKETLIKELKERIKTIEAENAAELARKVAAKNAEDEISLS